MSEEHSLPPYVWKRQWPIRDKKEHDQLCFAASMADAQGGLTAQKNSFELIFLCFQNYKTKE